MSVVKSLDGKKLYEHFAAQFKELQDEGLKDFKVSLHLSKDSSTDGILLVLSNVLRLRKEGSFIRANIK